MKFILILPFRSDCVNLTIVHLTRQNDWLTSFYREDTKELWSGDFFRVKADEKAIKMGYADKDDMTTVNVKISLCAEDRV